MILLFDRELLTRRFPEIGWPYRLFRDPSGERVAICSCFGHLQWPGRICSEKQAFLHRVSLYDSSLQHRFAVLDLGGRSTINDVSFHPERPELLIGTGQYDGGFCFEGQLLHWNWVSGSCDSLLGESREVVRCRFEKDGCVSFVLRPRNEEEYWDPADTTGIGTMDHSLIYVVAKIDQPEPMEPCYPDPRLEHLQPSDPKRAGFFIAPDSWPPVLAEHEMDFLREKGFQERGCIRDLRWLDAESFAVAHDHCHIEIGDIRGQSISRFCGEGHGVELIGTPDGCLVHVFKPRDHRKAIEARSTLYSYSNGKLSPFAAFDYACSFSSDEMGNLLARDVRYFVREGQYRNDAILRPDGKVIFQADLGKSNLANRAFRFHADKLYFLRGTPPESHERKTLCSVDCEGKIEELTSWDGANWHAMSSLVAILPDGLVRALEIYSPDTHHRTSVVERLSFTDNSIRWSTQLKQGSFTVLAASPYHGCVAFAQANGDYGLIDLSSGDILHLSAATVDHVSTIITSLAFQANHLLAGTIDGRVILFGLVV